MIRIIITIIVNQLHRTVCTSRQPLIVIFAYHKTISTKTTVTMGMVV